MLLQVLRDRFLVEWVDADREVATSVLMASRNPDLFSATLNVNCAIGQSFNLGCIVRYVDCC